jgi:hypothetical protein
VSSRRPFILLETIIETFFYVALRITEELKSVSLNSAVEPRTIKRLILLGRPKEIKTRGRQLSDFLLK